MARDNAIMTTDETIQVRLQRVEKDIDKLQAQLNLYVPVTISDLKIGTILEATNRISAELQDVKSSYNVLATRLTEQQENTSKIQINVLRGAVGTFISIIAQGHQ